MSNSPQTYLFGQGMSVFGEDKSLVYYYLFINCGLCQDLDTSRYGSSKREFKTRQYIKVFHRAGI